MTGEVILRDPEGDWLYVMARPDPPESDTVVRRHRLGGHIVYRFAGYEDQVPVYVREDADAVSK